MNITILQENIVSTLTTASKFAPSKTTTLPVINNFLLSASKDVITVTASDLETVIEVIVPGKVEEEGDVLLPSKTAISLLSSFSGEKLSIQSNDHSLIIKGASSHVSLKSGPVGDFPRVVVENEMKKIRVSSAFLVYVFQKVSIAASSDQARAVLTGVLFDIVSGSLSVVATDGFRLAKLSYEKGVFKEKILLPAKVIRALSSILKGDEGEFADVVVRDDGQIVFLLKGVRFVTRVIEGVYPDYQRIIPATGTTKVIVGREDLLRAVKFGAVLARESSNIIKMAIQGESVIISANAPQTGKNEMSIPSKTDGDVVDIAFNYRFLVDFLQADNAQEVSFETNGPLSPGVFRFVGNASYLYVVMPVRLQDEQ